MPALAQSPLLHQKMQTSASEEPLCPKNVRTVQPLSPDCGRLLWTVPKNSQMDSGEAHASAVIDSVIGILLFK